MFIIGRADKTRVMPYYVQHKHINISWQSEEKLFWQEEQGQTGKKSGLQIKNHSFGKSDASIVFHE